jgi:hypothetical protein
MQIEYIHPKATREMLGYIPDFVSTNNDRPARAQLHEMYSHGGGWRPFNGFTLNDDLTLSYPGDDPVLPLAKMQLRDEQIVVYQHAWVAIIQPDRSFEVCRMD